MTALVVSVIALFGIPLAFLAVLALRFWAEQHAATRRAARRFDESVDRLLAGRDEHRARVLLFPAAGRSVMGTPKTEPDAAQTARALTRNASPDDRKH